jgi:hypothetical protein
MEDEASSPAEGVAPEDDEPIEGTEPEGSDVEEPDEEPSDEEAPDGEDDGDDTEEFDELNIGGEKLRTPKGAIPEDVLAKLNGFSKNLEAGYTKKYQEVAETRKQLEARTEAVRKLETLNGDALMTFSRGLAIRSELEQLQQVDLNALWQSNPDQARRYSDMISQKTGELNNIINQVTQKEAQLTQAQEQEVQRRMAEGRQIVEREIKDFSAREPEVIDYVVKNCDMSQEEAKTWPLYPNNAKMAYKAMMYDRMQASTKPKPAPKPAQAKPFTPVKGKGGNAVKDVSNMSTSDMAKYLGLPG